MFEQDSEDLINVCYDDSISLENKGKLIIIKIKTKNELAAQNLKKFLDSTKIMEKKDGRKDEDDYQIELIKDSELIFINISGDLATALSDLMGLSYISVEKEKQLRLQLADIIIASRKGNAAKMLFHRQPFHILERREPPANGKAQPAQKMATTNGNGPSKKP